MAGKIFYRERQKMHEEEKQPRFKVVAVTGTDIKFYGEHLRKMELEQIAEATNAELILLKHGEKKGKDDGCRCEGTEEG